MRINGTWLVAAVVVVGLACGRCGAAEAVAASRAGVASASATAPNSSADGAIDGDRFGLRPGMCWEGTSGAKTWWWQLRFAEPRPVGAILQVHGDQPSILSNAPSRYRWQASLDGQHWQDLSETEVCQERRLFRLHRLVKACRATYLRLMIDACLGEAPVLREMEVYADPGAKVEFGDWIVAVSTATQDRRLPGFAGGFERLVRECPGWENVFLQHIWLGDMDESFVAAEPRPLCALLSGNTLEWCQQPHEPWRGLQEVLRHRNLPIWAACGGAQALAILQETGVDKPWDCPRCRDPNAPKSPVYAHLGHTGPTKCGDYTKNVWERGKFNVRLVARDPVFQGLPDVFEVMESHVGQVAYVPKGWLRLATKGPGALTENQCLRLADRYIYAAQFHIEMAGTPENSRKILGNFLRLAKAWGGYNPQGKPVPPPDLLPADTSGRPGPADDHVAPVFQETEVKAMRTQYEDWLNRIREIPASSQAQWEARKAELRQQALYGFGLDPLPTNVPLDRRPVLCKHDAQASESAFKLPGRLPTHSLARRACISSLGLAVKMCTAVGFNWSPAGTSLCWDR